MDAIDATDVIEVVLSWDAVVLQVEHVAPGRILTLGERGDLFLPAELLGAERVELVRHEPGGATVVAPPSAALRLAGREVAAGSRTVDLARGQVAELAIGAFTLTVTRVVAERCAKAPPLEGLRDSGAGYIAGSAFVHAVAFCFVALIAPSLGATEEDPFDADRLALMQRMLNASAAREAERPREETPPSTGGDVNAGKPAEGREGAAGRPDTTKAGRWAAKGNARPETATLAREHTLTEASTFGAVGILATAIASDPDAPVVTWGTVSNGSDDVSKIGMLFGGTIDDGRGSGGLGLLGPDQGGGGTANAIGMNGIGGLGHTGTGCPDGSPCSGFGVGHDRPGGGHPSHFKGPRYSTPTTNGRLAPEIIQRVVRLNDGRYRNCYQTALRTDPGLTGRVTVKFMIDRTGAVGFAADGGSDIPDEGVRRCVVSSFMSLSFPAPDSGTVTVVYPITFSPE